MAGPREEHIAQDLPASSLTWALLACLSAHAVYRHQSYDILCTSRTLLCHSSFSGGEERWRGGDRRP